MARNGMLKGEVGKLNTKQYLENERTYLKLAKQLGIPPEELDIALWMLGNGSGEFYG
jgi:thermostable 8-oxoguanine DNA glycosylase